MARRGRPRLFTDRQDVLIALDPADIVVLDRVAAAQRRSRAWVGGEAVRFFLRASGAYTDQVQQETNEPAAEPDPIAA